MNLRKRILSLRLFLASVTFAISLMGIVGKELLLVLLNGAVPARSVKESVMKKLANPEAVLWLGAGIIIMIGVVAIAIISICM